MKNDNSQSILVVDDDPSNISLYIELLSEMGLSKGVFSAPNGEIALKIARNRKPSLIITDWQMPKMSGLELVSALKEDETLKDIYIIMITAVMIGPLQLKSAFEMGANDFVRKPFDNHEFIARVKNSLDLIAAREALILKNIAYEKQNIALIEAEEAKKRFFINIAHDLRLPLTLILGQSEILLEQYEDYLPRAVKQKVDLINKSGHKLSNLVEEITALIKLENGEIQLKKSNIKFSNLIDGVLELLQPIGHLKNITLTIEESAEGDCYISIDPVMMEKVLLNIISNALKFTPENGVVMISCQKHPDLFELRINDSGPGISEQNIPHIFERFFRSPEDNINQRTGLGIGLALSKEIIEAHGGKISVDSTNSGTTMIINIPIDESGEMPSVSEYKSSIRHHHYLVSEYKSDSISIPVAETQSESPKATILLVEDIEEIRAFITELLHDEYAVIQASNGAAALKKLKSHSVDLIITDILMPVMDGIQLFTEIRNHNEYQDIPGLIVSSRLSDENEMTALGLGINNFLMKPFNANELKLRIKNILDLKNSSSNSVPEVFEKYNLDHANKILIKKLEQFVTSRLDDSRINVQALSKEIAFSERKLFRFIKSTLDITPLEFIKQIRFQMVRKMLLEGNVKTLKDASKAIGMSNVSEFKIQYLNRFGEIPEL